MTTPPRYDLLLGAGTLLIGLAWYVWYGGKKRLPYPPGPKRVPVVGNLFSMPSNEEWVAYRKWSEEYGTARDAVSRRRLQLSPYQVPTSYTPM